MLLICAIARFIFILKIFFNINNEIETDIKTKIPVRLIFFLF